MNSLEEKARDTLRAAGIAPGALILAAVSGGPDSTAMLCALRALAEREGFRVTACTVDHGIRDVEESEADVRFVEELCRTMGADLTVRRIPHGECPRRAQQRHASLEETARDMRHALLRQVAEETGATVIALGHTEDDNIETLLMRVLAGADAAGLRGITARRGPFVRPLLCCSRAEVIDYLQSRGQGWREDATNSDRAFLRNRVRHSLVPVLEKEFPGYRTGLLAMARKASAAADLAARQAAAMRWERTPNGFSIAGEDFLAAHPATRLFGILQMYDTVRPPGAPRRLPSRFLDRVTGITSLPDNACLVRGHGMALRVVEGRLHWERDIARQGKKGYFIDVSATGDVAIRGAGLRLRMQRGPDAGAAVAGEATLQVRDVKPPLVLRSRRKGDSISLPGGVASVNSLMATWKIPAQDRDRVPILADRDGVLAVLGGALGYRNRARAGAPGGESGGADRVVVHMVRDMEEGREQQQRQR